jgi:dipeptidyl aminopeptidase/acylaminoacyl peptidase
MRWITPLLVAAMSSAVVAQAGRPDVVQPGESLVVKGLPPIERAVVEEAGRYAEFRAAAVGDWHPTRREMLVETRFANTYQIHHVAFPGAARYQLTFFPEPVGVASYPRAGEPDFFVLGKDVGGNEFQQLFRYGLADGRATLLTDGKSRNTLGPWSNDGRRIAYGSTRRTGGDVDLWVMDPRDATTDRMATELKGGGHAALDWSPDDRTLLVGEYVSVNESYLWLMPVDGGGSAGGRTLLTPRAEPGAEPVAYGGGAFAADGKSLYLTTDLGSEFRRLARFDLEGRQYEYLTSDADRDVDDIAMSRDRSKLAFLTNDEGISRLHLLDTKTGERTAVPGIPVGVIGGLNWHANGRDLAFHLSSARSSTDVYSVDVETMKLERWTRSESGGLNTEAFVEPQLVRWKGFDGLELSGFLYTPPADKFPGKRPVIIHIHGGPEGQFRPSFLGRNNYYLNEMGVALLFPNVRGSSGYGKSFLKMDNGAKREDSYRDIETLLDWIGQREDLDPQRVMVTGGSYGGHMTLAVATRYADRIAAALSVVGMSNLVTFLERTETYRRDLRRVEYGDERDPTMRQFLLDIAPINRAERITKPLFIVQGANDPRVPLNEAEQMVATMERIGTPVWYLMAKDEGHGFAKKGNVDFQFYATTLFVRQYLLN